MKSLLLDDDNDDKKLGDLESFLEADVEEDEDRVPLFELDDDGFDDPDEDDVTWNPALFLGTKWFGITLFLLFWNQVGFVLDELFK